MGLWPLRERRKITLTLEKYRRADEAKIKELTLNIEKLTVEVAKKAGELEKEVTETQAAQIELDKTAEDFNVCMLNATSSICNGKDAVENSRKRDELINETGEQYGSAERLPRQKEGRPRRP